MITMLPMAVSARTDKNMPSAANVDMTRGRPVRAGAFTYEGADFVSGWHTHDMHQLEYALEGYVEVTAPGVRHLLPPQQAAWIPAGMPHQSGFRRVRSVSVFFAPAMVDGADDRVRILAAAPVIREMLEYATRWPVDRPASDATADAFFEALALLARDWIEHEAPLCLPTSTEPAIAAAMEYTQRHLDSVTAATVGAAVGMSDRTLRRRFGAATGMTWRQYVLESRLQRAMALLTEPDRTVMGVSTEVGFDSVSAFTRAFRQLTGETPGAYRKRVTAA
jgi:AraC-like DNA-binding protein